MAKGWAYTERPTLARPGGGATATEIALGGSVRHRGCREQASAGTHRNEAGLPSYDAAKRPGCRAVALPRGPAAEPWSPQAAGLPSSVATKGPRSAGLRHLGGGLGRYPVLPGGGEGRTGPVSALGEPGGSVAPHGSGEQARAWLSHAQNPLTSGFETRRYSTAGPAARPALKG